MALPKPFSSLSFTSYNTRNPLTKPAGPSSPLFSTSRRIIITVPILTSHVLIPIDESHSPAFAVDLFKMIESEPPRTVQEAEQGIKQNAKDLIGLKDLIEEKSWNEMQRVLRGTSSKLKQDMYSVIQAKPGTERPILRKLYSNLFNNVTRLDYAARDQNEDKVRECYANIVAVLDEVLARI